MVKSYFAILNFNILKQLKFKDKKKKNSKTFVFPKDTVAA